MSWNLNFIGRHNNASIIASGYVQIRQSSNRVPFCENAKDRHTVLALGKSFFHQLFYEKRYLLHKLKFYQKEVFYFGSSSCVIIFWWFSDAMIGKSKSPSGLRKWIIRHIYPQGSTFPSDTCPDFLIKQVKCKQLGDIIPSNWTCLNSAFLPPKIRDVPFKTSLESVANSLKLHVSFRT